MSRSTRWRKPARWRGRPAAMDIGLSQRLDPLVNLGKQGRISESLSGYEQPLWVGVTIRDGGFDLSTVWPAIDFLRLSKDIFD